MSRKHAKRRTIYNTEPGFDPVRHAIVGAGVMQVSMQNRLQVVELRALDAIKAGTATDMQLEIFAGMCCVARFLAKQGAGIELLDVCDRAAAAVEAGRRRFEEFGKVGRAAGEYETFAELCELHTLQRKSVSHTQYENAMRAAIRACGAAIPA